MKKLKEQRGITLIALIITIIVMLILVAVTVTVALNGGLFKTAKQAASETDVEKEKELLLEVVMGAMGKDGKVDFEKLASNDMFSGTETGDGILKVTINESGREYTITERGTINVGGGAITPPVEEPEEPSDPGSGNEPDVSEPLEAGLYAPDGTFTPWADLTTGGSPIIPVTDGVIGEVSSTNRATLSGKLIISDGVTSIGYQAFEDCTELTLVTIPDSVTKIVDWSFSGCTSLTQVNIPGTVTIIGDEVFAGCYGLKQVNVEESNPNYCSENGVLYNKNKTYLLKYPSSKTETTFTIPNSVTYIWDHAFNQASFDSITIPNSVEGIGMAAFAGCENLTSVVFPDGNIYISDFAFCGCPSLTELTIPNSLTNIGAGLFQGCTGLTQVTIPSSVKRINEYAFDGCTNLTATIQGNNAEVVETAFGGVPTVYYAGYVEGEDYSSWGATQVLPLPSGT